MFDVVLAIVVVGVCVAMLVAASRMEPHWVNKDGSRFIARIQALGTHDIPDGPWREMRITIDGPSLVVSARGLRGSRLRGHYVVVAKSPEPPRKRAVYVISGPQKAVLRLPDSSRAVPRLDELLDERLNRPNRGND